MMGLMFIGGSPGSCAGGVKTTTAAVGWAYVRSSLRGRQNLVLLGRTIPRVAARRAALVLLLALLWNGLGVVILAACQQGAGDLPPVGAAAPPMGVPL